MENIKPGYYVAHTDLFGGRTLAVEVYSRTFDAGHDKSGAKMGQQRWNVLIAGNEESFELNHFTLIRRIKL